MPTTRTLDALDKIRSTEPTFMALVSILDTTARQRLPRPRASEERFPTEIYRFVLVNIVDFETHCACKMVYRVFRELCQENMRVGNNAVTIVPIMIQGAILTLPSFLVIISMRMIESVNVYGVVSYRIMCWCFASSTTQRVFHGIFL